MQAPAIRVGAIVTVLGAGAAPALADRVVVRDAVDARTGAVVGASIDGGNMGCQTRTGSDCGDGMRPAGGFSLHGGAMVAPHVALLAELWGMRHTDDDARATQVLVTANLRTWVIPRVWVQAGLGVARSKVSFDDGFATMSSTSSIVPAVSGALGVELVQSPGFGLDLQLRAGTGLYEDDVRIYNAAFGVGVSFF
jgi:hypothetical protein